jgi:hypothetical protein
LVQARPVGPPGLQRDELAFFGDAYGIRVVQDRVAQGALERDEQFAPECAKNVRGDARAWSTLLNHGLRAHSSRKARVEDELELHQAILHATHELIRQLPDGVTHRVTTGNGRREEVVDGLADQQREAPAAVGPRERHDADKIARTSRVHRVSLNRQWRGGDAEGLKELDRADLDEDVEGRPGGGAAGISLGFWGEVA